MSNSDTSVFGPVPSRRLGQSLGINNIPHKHCSYSCIYCQVGKAVKMQAERDVFLEPQILIQAVQKRLEEVKEDQLPDYLTIVPDGEPTLDRNLGKLIDGLKETGYPVAVITNGSLLQFPDVSTRIAKADFVSVKVDAASETLWKRVNRPHKSLDFQRVKEGIIEFASGFRGELVTETMLVRNENDNPSELDRTADLIQQVEPDIAYIAVPTRPPAYKDVHQPTHHSLVQAYEIFRQRKLDTELLTGYEGNSFVSTGNLAEDLLRITAVHPIRQDAVEALKRQSGDRNEVVEELIREEKVTRVRFGRYNYYVRNFTKPGRQTDE